MGNENATTRLTRSAEELRIGKRAEQKGELRVSKPAYRGAVALLTAAGPIVTAA